MFKYALILTGVFGTILVLGWLGLQVYLSCWARLPPLHRNDRFRLPGDESQ